MEAFSIGLIYLGMVCMACLGLAVAVILVLGAVFSLFLIIERVWKF